MKAATSLILAALALAAPFSGAAYAQTAPGQTGAIVGEGKVNAVDAKAGKINLTHGPIPALQWPGMTMDFAVLPGTDLSGIKVGDQVTFTLGRAPDGMYAIQSVKPKK